MHNYNDEVHSKIRFPYQNQDNAPLYTYKLKDLEVSGITLIGDDPLVALLVKDVDAAKNWEISYGDKLSIANNYITITDMYGANERKIEIPEEKKEKSLNDLRFENLLKSTDDITNKFEYNNKTIYLSTPFIFHKRPTYIMYVPDSNGKYTPRIAYLSNSQGVFRFVDNSFNDHFGKSFLDEEAITFEVGMQKILFEKLPKELTQLKQLNATADELIMNHVNYKISSSSDSISSSPDYIWNYHVNSSEEIYETLYYVDKLIKDIPKCKFVISKDWKSLRDLGDFQKTQLDMILSELPQNQPGKFREMKLAETRDLVKKLTNFRVNFMAKHGLTIINQYDKPSSGYAKKPKTEEEKQSMQITFIEENYKPNLETIEPAFTRQIKLESDKNLQSEVKYYKCMSFNGEVEYLFAKIIPHKDTNQYLKAEFEEMGTYVATANYANQKINSVGLPEKVLASSYLATPLIEYSKQSNFPGEFCVSDSYCYNHDVSIYMSFVVEADKKINDLLKTTKIENDAEKRRIVQVLPPIPSAKIDADDTEKRRIVQVLPPIPSAKIDADDTEKRGIVTVLPAIKRGVSNNSNNTGACNLNNLDKTLKNQNTRFTPQTFVNTEKTSAHKFINSQTFVNTEKTSAQFINYTLNINEDKPSIGK